MYLDKKVVANICLCHEQNEKKMSFMWKFRDEEGILPSHAAYAKGLGSTQASAIFTVLLVITVLMIQVIKPENVLVKTLNSML